MSERSPVSAASAPPTRHRWIARSSRPGYRVLSLAVLLGSAALVWVYQRATVGVPVGAATGIGRWYGLIGTLLFLYLAAYGVRRVTHRGRAGSLETWYRTHLVFGVLATALLLVHCGVAMRTPFLAVLQVGFWGTVLTGLFGWVYQTALKRWLIQHEARPTILKEVEARRSELLARLEALEKEEGGSSRGVATALRHMATVRGQNLWRMPDWGFWDRQVDELLGSGRVGDIPLGAGRLIRELNRMDVLRFYHRLLRWWTTVHLLLTALGVQMVVWHVWMVGWYPR